MNRDWQKDLEIRRPLAAASLPPAMFDEAEWDILLALHEDRQYQLSLEKLASLISVVPTVMGRWLGLLEARQLVTGSANALTGEVHAVLTRSGRALLDRYLAATTDLQSRIRQ